MKLRKLVWCFLLLLCAGTAAYAQDACPDTVARALAQVGDACGGLGRNQACYGNVTLDATPRANAADFAFAAPGDVANVVDVETLTLSNMDAAADTWGIAVLSLQASLPDSVPGQNVTFLLFGSVEVTNAVPPALALDVTTTANARVRSAPTTTAGDNVLFALPAGTTLVANGRTDDGAWVRVLATNPNTPQQGEKLAWVSTQVVRASDGDLSTLNVVREGDPLFTPMQAFTFNTGIGDRPCEQAPDSGILVQSPQGAGLVSFSANGVRVSMGSTVYMQANGGAMTVSVVEGMAALDAGGASQVVPAGTYSSVPLDAGGLANGAPSVPLPYDAAALAALPLGTALPDTVGLTPPLAAGAIDDAIQTALGSIGGMDGTWQLNWLDVITHQDSTGAGICTMHQQPGFTFIWENLDFEPDALYFPDFIGGGSAPLIAPGVYGDPAAAHDGLRSARGLALDEYRDADTYVLLSPTQVDRHVSWANHWAGSDGVEYYAACETFIRMVWLGG